jgi:hypothetical protein
MNRRAPSRTTRKAPARNGRGGSRNSATLNVTGLKLGSLITFNFGGGRGRSRQGGGLFSRLRKATASTLAALKGADYSRAAHAGAPAGAGSGRGSFDRFRSSRPDLFDPEHDEGDLTDDETPDCDPDTDEDDRPGGDR